MKRMNKLLSMLMALVLCLSLMGGFGTTTQALEQTEENQYYLSVDQGYEADLYSDTSDSVEVNIRLSDLGSARISSLLFQTEWDNSKLEMTGYKVYKLSFYDSEGNLDTMGATLGIMDENENIVNYQNYSEACTFACAYASAYGSFLSENDVLATIRFKVKDDVEPGEMMPITLFIDIDRISLVTTEEIPIEPNSYTFEAIDGYVIAGKNPKADLIDEIIRCTQIMDSINVCNECYSLPLYSLWLTEEEAESNRQAIAVAQAVVNDSDATKEEIDAALQTLNDSFIEPRNSSFQYLFTIQNDESTITGYKGTPTELAIPSTLDGYPVTSIGDRAFYNCDSLTSVEIGNSVTSIGDFAFYSCDFLTSLEIGNNVETIGNGAFSGCASLTSVTIGDSVESIGNDAFSGCESLSSVAILDSVTSIGEAAFYSCTSLTGVDIPDSVTSIGNRAFIGCDSLTHIDVDSGNPNYKSSDGVLFTKDGTELIQYPCGKGDVAYTIPDSVISIGDRAFYNCDSLTSVEIGNSVTSIGEDAFYDCESLISVTIGNSVTSIGDCAFNTCDSLTSVVIGKSVESIGDEAFDYCWSLRSIFFQGPKNSGFSVYSYGSSEEGFFQSIDATMYYLAENTSSWAPNGEIEWGGFELKPYDNLPTTKEDFFYTIHDNKATIIGYTGSDESVLIPSELDGCPVTAIGNRAFYNCEFLTSVTIPDSVTSIGPQAFYDTPWLDGQEDEFVMVGDGVLLKYNGSNAAVTIPSNVKYISDAFRNCDSMESVVIPQSVTCVGNEAFYDCDSLTSVTIPDSVTNIGRGAFMWCSSLKNLVIGNSVKNIGGYSFYSCSLTNVIIPDSVTRIGAWAFSWCDDLTSLVIGKKVASIGNDAFSRCESLTSVTIPDSVTSIEDKAFCLCKSLTSVTLGNSVASIGDEAFRSCESLPSVEIPGSVESIGDYAFDWCNSLISVTIGNSVESIGNRAFAWCSSLTSVEISDSVESIGDEAFGNCKSLTEIVVDSGSVSYKSIDGVLFSKDGTILIQYPIGKTATAYTIPDSVTRIGDAAFYNCESLTSVSIPDSVKSIGFSAFYGNSSLTSAKIGNNVTSIGPYAFCCNSSLTSMTIPGSVNSIEYDAFSYCESLTDVIIPDSVTSIGTGAFSYCPVTFHCNLDSYAAEYAEDNNIPVEEIVRILGDADSSGSVDSADASQILRWVVKLIKNDAIDLTAANVTGGSTVSSADASKILRWIVRLIPTLGLD